MLTEDQEAERRLAQLAGPTALAIHLSPSLLLPPACLLYSCTTLINWPMNFNFISLITKTFHGGHSYRHFPINAISMPAATVNSDRAMAGRWSSQASSVFPVTVFAHLLLVSVTTLLLVWLVQFRGGFAFRSADKNRIFNLHPLLMVVGFLMISGEAIMAYTTIPVKRKTQKKFHMTLNLIAFLAGIVGIYAVFKYHHERSSPDLYTLHSWFGICAICLFGFQWLLGFLAFWLPHGKETEKAKFSPWHILFGIVIFTLAILSALTGLVERFVALGLRRSREALIMNFTGLLIFLFGVSVVVTVLHHHW